MYDNNIIAIFHINIELKISARQPFRQLYQ